MAISVLGAMDSSKDFDAIFQSDNCVNAFLQGNAIMILNGTVIQRLADLSISWQYESFYIDGVSIRIPKEHELIFRVAFADVIIQNF